MKLISKYNIEIVIELKDLSSIDLIKPISNKFSKTFKQDIIFSSNNNSQFIVKFDLGISSVMHKKQLDKAKILSMWLQEASENMKISIVTPEETYILQ